MKVIGISGKIGTGKTTLTNILLEQLKGKWERKAFGDFLKEEVSEIFRFSKALCYDEDGKKQLIQIQKHVIPRPSKDIMTVREILQWWGTEVRRKENMNSIPDGDSHYMPLNMTTIDKLGEDAS